MMTYKTMENFDRFESMLNSDIRYADPVANDFKDGLDAIDFIKQYIGSGWESDKFYKDNIKSIKQDLKAGHNYLYTDNEGTSEFYPVGYMSIQDFYNYDNLRDSAMLEGVEL